MKTLSEVLKPGVEITPSQKIKNEIAVAGNAYIVAKDTMHIDSLKAHETMDRMLKVAQTREGLAALIELHGKPVTN